MAAVVCHVPLSITDHAAEIVVGLPGTDVAAPDPNRRTLARIGLLPNHDFLFILDEMSREALGHFELMVLLALMRLDDEAYGVPIAKLLEESTHRDVLVGSVYAALERLEAKGFVSSQTGEPTPERGGRAKRYFRITENGLSEVRATRAALIRLWQAIPALQGGT
jgi:DNA-binding PadR family transcriptional regulator